MDIEKLKPIIDNIITDAFDRIEYAYQYHREGIKKDGIEPMGEDIKTRLIFPRYFDTKDQNKINRGNKSNNIKVRTRISEQELRFAFVEAFNASDGVKENHLFYSIETPTEGRYYFSGKEPKMVSKDKKGRSAAFDLVIYDKNLTRICLIEFKAKSVKPKDYIKDLLKLYKEIDNNETVLCYFINVFRSSDSGTIPTMKNKIKLFAEKEGFSNQENIIIGYDVLETTNKGLIPLRELIRD